MTEKMWDRVRQLDKRRVEIENELEGLRRKHEVIKARHTKDIWTDSSISKERLRMAELTLRIEADPESHAIWDRQTALREELMSIHSEEMILYEQIRAERPPEIGR